MTAGRPCYHCGEALPSGDPIFARLGDIHQPMCCLGCKAVAELIHASGLEAFYAHRSEPLAGYGLKPGETAWDHYDDAALRQQYVHESNGSAEAIIEIGGMYCSACVWLLNNVLEAEAAVREVSVNPSTRRALVRWDPAAMHFSELLSTIATVGFKPQPRAAGIESGTIVDEQRIALRRLIVAAAAGMQVMMFAFALYAGAHYGIEGRIEQFLRIISLLVCLPVIFYSAQPFFAGAVRGLQARTPGMDLPVALAMLAAFAASAYATFSGTGEIYFDSVAMFVLFLSGTRYLEMRARHRSDDLTRALTAMLPETVTRLVDGEVKIIPLDRLAVGDVVLVKPGDIVAADGEIVSGDLDIDESLLTGEAIPIHRPVGSQVSAGSMNRAGTASMLVKLVGASTSVAETARLLERARADRPRIAVLADRIASRFVIGVLAVTMATVVIWMRVDPERAFEIALATLVVTCPCALALATPAALAAAASQLASRGLLLVRSRLLEVLAADTASGKTTIVFDKTGTLTAGRPAVERMDLVDASASRRECLSVAATLETSSEHVLARAFAGVADTTLAVCDRVNAVPGRGMEGRIDNRTWRIGSESYVQELSGGTTASLPFEDARTTVYLGNEAGLMARFTLGDELRADAQMTVQELQALNYRLVIASGDREGPVRAVANKLGIDDWHAALNPAAKLALVAKLQAAGQRVVMVGDGINDAPVLAAADASLAIDTGTALARASADAIVPGRRLIRVVDAAVTARRTRRVVRQNIGWAVVYNLAAVPLAACGYLAPWMAAIGMSLSSLLVVSNAMRLRRFESARLCRKDVQRSQAKEAATGSAA